MAVPGGGNDDDRVTQALLGCPATVLEEREGWARCDSRTTRGSWTAPRSRPGAVAASGEVLTVTARGAPLYPTPTQWGAARRGIPRHGAAGCRPPSGARLPVALPGGRGAWIDTAAGERRPSGAPPPRRSAATAVQVARQFLGCPYLWGGSTYRGVDCSALLQRAYALAGYALPRDADQQWAALPTAVAREALREGDLLFFARDGAIIHVALALDGTRYIHALGHSGAQASASRASIQRPRTSTRVLATLYLGARRVVT